MIAVISSIELTLFMIRINCLLYLCASLKKLLILIRRIRPYCLILISLLNYLH